MTQRIPLLQADRDAKAIADPCFFQFFLSFSSHSEIIAVHVRRETAKFGSSSNGTVCRGRGRPTLEAPLDLKRSWYLAALWNLDRGSRRTRRHTQHRIRPGDTRWNVHVYRGKPCRKARALGRSDRQRCLKNSTHKYGSSDSNDAHYTLSCPVLQPVLQ